MVLLQHVYSIFQPYLCSLPVLFLVPHFTPANPPQPSLLSFMVFLCCYPVSFIRDAYRHR